MKTIKKYLKAADLNKHAFITKRRFVNSLKVLLIAFVLSLGSLLSSCEVEYRVPRYDSSGVIIGYDLEYHHHDQDWHRHHGYAYNRHDRDDDER